MEFPVLWYGILTKTEFATPDSGELDMKIKNLSEQETAQYAQLLWLAYRQLADMQKQLGAGMGLWQRWCFRSRHHRIQRLLSALLHRKGDTRGEAEKSIEQDLKIIKSGKKGWSYVSTGQIEFLQGLLEGL